MATTQNSSMVLDDAGFPRTLATTDNISFNLDGGFSIAQNLNVGGNLTVLGDIVSGGTMDVVVSDNFIDLSNGQVNGTNKAGGLTVNVQSAVPRVVNALGNMAFTGGNEFAIPGWNPSTGGVGAASLAAGDIIEIAECVDLAGNNGLFVVLSVVAAVGGKVTINGAVQTQSPWAQTAFENGTETTVTASLAPAVDLGVFCISDGALLDAGAAAIPLGAFASAWAPAAKSGGLNANITYEAAANVSLQEAYVVGSTITMVDTEGNLTIATDDSGARADFILRTDVLTGGVNWLSTSAGLLTVGSAATNKVAMSGQLTTDLIFDGVAGRKISQNGQNILIETTVNGGIHADSADGLTLAANGTTANDFWSGSCAGTSEPSIATAAAYVAGASLAGTMVGEYTNAAGNSQAIVLTSATAGAATVALLLGGMSDSLGFLVFSDTVAGPAGTLQISTIEHGSRVTFEFTSDTAGLAASIGCALPFGNNRAGAAMRLRTTNAAGDVEIASQRNLDLYSATGGIQLASQTGEVNAYGATGVMAVAQAGEASLLAIGSGAADIAKVISSGTDANAAVIIDAGAGGLALSGNTQARLASVTGPVVIQSTIGALTMEAVDDSSLAITGASKSLTISTNSVGGTLLLDSPSIHMDGWVELKSMTEGFGLEEEAGVLIAVGDVVCMDAAVNVPEVIKANGRGADSLARVFGVALTGGADGTKLQVHTVHGAPFLSNFTSLTGDIGKELFLSVVGGLLTKDATTLNAAGDTVFRVGYVHSVGANCEVIFAPQFIAKRM